MWSRVLTAALAVVSVGLYALFVVWLAHSVESPSSITEDPWLQRYCVAAVVIVFIIESLHMVNIVSISLATIVAREPVLPERINSLRAALFITFVPSTEDLGVLESTLRAAQSIDHHGLLDIYVLDERNIDADRVEDVRRLCERLNARDIPLPQHEIHYFSRKLHEKYADIPTGPFAAKTKYGNINSLLDHLDRHGVSYDVVTGIDPDHIPVPEFLTLLLGHLDDPDVGFVVAPQTYSNAEYSTVAYLAESQQFAFHSVIQPAANAYRAPMLVGTNYAIRWDVLQRIGGMEPSITEDLATTFKILGLRNPDTGNTYTSVYTPAVVANGEGPETWGGFFSQQNRWARGSFELLITPAIRHMLGMWRRPMRLFHYALIMAFYPSMAIVWMIGAVNAAIYALFGINGVIVSPAVWVMLYGWATVMQFAVYIRARRHNVSPFESQTADGHRAWGLAGMMLSTLTAPIYANALVQSLLRRPVTFVVTPKGTKAATDTWYTFRLHLGWALFYAVIIALCFFHGFATVSALTWPVCAIVIALTPFLLSLYDRRLNHAVRPSAEQTTITDHTAVEELPTDRLLLGDTDEPAESELQPTVPIVAYRPGDDARVGDGAVRDGIRRPNSLDFVLPQRVDQLRWLSGDPRAVGHHRPSGRDADQRDSRGGAPDRETVADRRFG